MAKPDKKMKPFLASNPYRSALVIGATVYQVREDFLEISKGTTYEAFDFLNSGNDSLFDRCNTICSLCFSMLKSRSRPELDRLFTSVVSKCVDLNNQFFLGLRKEDLQRLFDKDEWHERCSDSLWDLAGELTDEVFWNHIENLQRSVYGAVEPLVLAYKALVAEEEPAMRPFYELGRMLVESRRRLKDIEEGRQSWGAKVSQPKYIASESVSKYNRWLKTEWPKLELAVSDCKKILPEIGKVKLQTKENLDLQISIFDLLLQISPREFEPSIKSVNFEEMLPGCPKPLLEKLGKIKILREPLRAKYLQRLWKHPPDKMLHPRDFFDLHRGSESQQNQYTGENRNTIRSNINKIRAHLEEQYREICEEMQLSFPDKFEAIENLNKQTGRGQGARWRLNPLLRRIDSPTPQG